MLDEPSECIRTTVEDEIVAAFARLRIDLGVRRDLLCVDERAIEAGLDAVVQKDGVECRARGRLESPKETLETPSDVSTPGNSLLIARMPSIVATADSANS